MPPAFACAGRLLALTGLVAVAGAAPADEAAPVAVEEVTREAIVREVVVNGSVVAPRTASLSTSIEGLVSEVAVEVGDRVQAGQRLIRLDPELERHALDGARAEVAEAQARLAEARRRLRVARSAGARTNVPETEVRARESEVRVAEAALQHLQAEARRYQGRVERHVVRAPFAGVISRRHAELGEWLEPGAAIAELVDVDNLRVELEVPQDAFRRLGEGATLEVSIGSDGGKLRPARIDSVVPVTDLGARTFRLRARVPDGAAAQAGMSARGALRVRTGERGLVVPLDALNRYPEGRVTVWVVRRGEDGARVREQRVRTGVRFGGRVELRSGVEAGMEVVVSGNAALRDGQRVAPR